MIDCAARDRRLRNFSREERGAAIQVPVETQFCNFGLPFVAITNVARQNEQENQDRLHRSLLPMPFSHGRLVFLTACF